MRTLDAFGHRLRSVAPRRTIAPALVLALAVAGCGDSGTAPTDPAPEAAVAAAVTTAPNFRLVTTGGYHACGIASDGRGFCWGLNLYGQVGDGTKTDRSRPVEITGGRHWLDLSAGEFHTCGVATDSLVYCWGSGGLGELGTGQAQNSFTPAQAGTRHYKQVTTGDHHSCAVTAANRAFCWGYNSDGQVGDGTFVGFYRVSPVAVAGTARFRRIIAGGRHTCGVTPNNQVYCWGAGEVGQLGDGTVTFRRPLPKAVAGGLSFVQVSAGDNHTCGIAADRRGYCWGGNFKGQLGDNTINDKAKPHLVAGGLTYNTLVAGNAFTCGVTGGNVAYCWGTNTDGQLGDGTVLTRLKPTAVAGGLAFAGVDAGNLSTCGVTTGKRAYCWGFNAQGQLGNGTNTGPETCRSNLPCARKPQAVVGP